MQASTRQPQAGGLDARTQRSAVVRPRRGHQQDAATRHCAAPSRTLELLNAAPGRRASAAPCPDMPSPLGPGEELSLVPTHAECQVVLIAPDYPSGHAFELEPPPEVAIHALPLVLDPKPPPAVLDSEAVQGLACAEHQMDTGATATPRQPGGMQATHHPVQDAVAVRRLSDDLGVGREKLSSIMSRWPSIAQLDLEYVSLSVLNLAALLQCKPAEAAAVVAREHRLLHTPVTRLHASMSALSQATRMPLPDLLPALREAPALLFQPPADAAARVGRVAEAFGVDTPHLISGAVSGGAGWLLSAPPQEIASRVTRLRELLDLQPGPQLLMSHPRLVCMWPDDVAAKMGVLSSALSIKPRAVQALVRREPGVLQMSAVSISAHVASLTALLVSLKDVQRAVFAEPSLLLRSPARLARSVTHLQQLLACPRPAVIQLVARRPCLLTRSPPSLGSSFRALAIWRLDPAAKLELLHAHPSLLRLSPQEVHGRCRWLRSLMLGNAYFHSALRELPPRLLGVIILHLPAAWSRLQYLAESSQEAGTDIMWAVQAKRAAFATAHSGYSRWLAFKCSDQGFAAPWRNNPAYQQTSGWNKRASTISGSIDVQHRQDVQARRGEHHHLQQDVSDAESEGLGTGSGGREVSWVEEVHEAKTMILGSHFLHKPKRSVNVAVLRAEVEPEAAAEQQGAAEAATVVL